MINSIVAGKNRARTPRDLARKSLGEQSGSPFTQRIIDVLPPKKKFMLKFNIYNGRTNLADYVRYYQKVMAYWFSDNDIMCMMFPVSLGDATLRWFTRLPAGQTDNFRELT